MANEIIFSTSEPYVFGETDFGYYGVFGEADFTLAVGEKYTVVWDGVPYECVGQEASVIATGAVALGNCSELGLSGNNEPFIIGWRSGYAYCMSTTDTAEGISHTIVIYSGDMYYKVAAVDLKSLGDAIRGRTGGSDGLVFPDGMIEAVEALIAGSGSGGGGTGGTVVGGTGALKMAAGSFKASTTPDRMTITHGLGVMPDFVVVYQSGILGLTLDEVSAQKPMLFAWGVSSEFASLVGESGGYVGVAGLGTSYSNYIDQSHSTMIYCPDANTFKVGAAASATAQKLGAGQTYKWLAIANMGGGAAMPADVHQVTFMNGTQQLYVRSVADGDNCADPVERGLIAAPEKTDTAQYDYTYNGWSLTDGGTKNTEALSAITADKTVYAAYSTSLQRYTITYYDEDGMTVLETESLAYGATPSYKPSKADFEFVGWSPAVSTVTGNASYTAQWEEIGVVVAEIADDWDTIIASVNDGTYKSKYKVGNYKPVTLYDGLVHKMQIVARDTDELADGSGTAALTFIAMEHGGLTAMQDSKQSITWANWTGRTTTIPEQYGTVMPENIMSAIKEVVKYSRGFDTTSSGRDVRTVDKLWIPSQREFFGSGETTGVRYEAVISGKLPKVRYKIGNTLVDYAAYLVRTKTKQVSGTLTTYPQMYVTKTGLCDTFGGLSGNILIGFCI